MVLFVFKLYFHNSLVLNMKKSSTQVQNGNKRTLMPQKFATHKTNRHFIYIHCKQGVCHIVASAFTLKSILRQKKNYGNSNISQCKNIIFKKSSKTTLNQNPSRCYNFISNVNFQHKPNYHLSKILI
jgi:hypothetical protein